MRTGIIMSVVGHVALLFCALINPARLQTAHGDTVSVELVSPAEFARAGKEAPAQPPASTPSPAAASAPAAEPPPVPAPAPQTKSAEAKSQPISPVKPTSEPPSPQVQPPQVQPPQASMPSPAAQPTPSPPPVNEMPADPNRLAALLHLPSNGEGFGSEAESGARLSSAEIAAFKAHLRGCWTLPPGIAETQRVKVIMRVALKPDGALASEPTLIEASASALGPPLVRSAMRALKSCAPYSMLPTAKYKEWKVLDLNFSPDAMAGG